MPAAKGSARTPLGPIVIFSEEELLETVREVSEDYIYDTLEFNEFLQMVSKQQEIVHTRTDLKSAFRQDWIQNC